MMKLLASALVVLTLAAGAALAETETGFAGRPITNNLFAPTGYTLHKGEFAVGLGPVAFGITENVQLGTNLLLWIFQVYNAELTCTSHRLSAASPDTAAPAALRSVGLLNVSPRIRFRGPRSQA